jgi:hypothetical protein
VGISPPPLFFVCFRSFLKEKIYIYIKILFLKDGVEMRKLNLESREKCKRKKCIIADDNKKGSREKMLEFFLKRFSYFPES